MNKARLMNRHFEEIFFRFQRLVKAAQQLPSFPQLDAIEEKLLLIIGFAYQNKAPLLVGELLSQSGVASQATIHGRLAMLHGKQLIKWQSDIDGRKKYAIPTAKASAYFSQIGECVSRAAAKK